MGWKSCGVLILSAALTVTAQQTPAGSGRIRGRVVRADTGAPLRGAQIALTGQPPFNRRVTSADDDGRYEFTELPAGRFRLTASQAGYVTLGYGQRRAFEDGRPVTLDAAQVLSQVDFALPRGGVVTGRITDEFGEPVTGAMIRVERHQYGPDGQRQLSTFGVSALNPFTLTTNDRGEFRVFGLMPGDYIVSARLQSIALPLAQGATADATEALLPTYYPGTVNAAQAQPIAIGLAQEVSAHFAMVPGQNVRVSGAVFDSAGRPAVGQRLSLLSVTATSVAFGNAGSVAADGSFSFGNVPPGDYVLQVRREPGLENEGASVPLSVSSASITGLRVTTSPGTTIKGRVEWDGAAPRPQGVDDTRLRISAIPADGRPALLGAGGFGDPDADGSVREDDSFVLGAITGKVTLRAIGLSPEWTLKAVMADEVDVTDAGADAARLGGDTRIRVIVTDKISDLAGSVRNARGQPLTEYVVVVLPQQVMAGVSGARFTRTARPDQSGSFHIRALPPGRYVAAAVDALEQGYEWDPQVQKRVRAAGTSFTVSLGQALTVTLDLLP